MSQRIDNQEDNFHNAAKAVKQGFGLGMAQAHDLIAASLGYKSKIAAIEDGVYPQDQWLHRHEPDHQTMELVIGRMHGVDQAELTKNINSIGRVILDGLAPECAESGIKSHNNIPVGDPREGDDCQWIHPSVARDDYSDYAFCPLCGDHTAYHVDTLDAHGLCPEHRGEFDLDAEEQEDLDSFIEYHTKDN
jgi:rubredoxin